MNDAVRFFGPVGLSRPIRGPERTGCGTAWKLLVRRPQEVVQVRGFVAAQHNACRTPTAGVASELCENRYPPGVLGRWGAMMVDHRGMMAAELSSVQMNLLETNEICRSPSMEWRSLCGRLG